MEAVAAKMVTGCGLFFVAVISGLIVSRSGRPFAIGIVTVHKLIAVAAAGFLILAFRRLFMARDGVTALEITLLAFSALLFLSLIATGALLTREEMVLPRIVLTMHRIAPVVVLVSAIAAVLVMSRGRA